MDLLKGRSTHTFLKLYHALFSNPDKETDLQTQAPCKIKEGVRLRGWGRGGPSEHGNCLHVPGPAFLISATPADFLMSRFVTPPARANGGASNVTAERGGRGKGVRERGVREVRWPGQWEVRSRSCGITPPHQAIASIQGRNVGGQRMLGALCPPLTLCVPAAGHHPGRSIPCGAATCQVHFPVV